MKRIVFLLSLISSVFLVGCDLGQLQNGETSSTGDNQNNQKESTQNEQLNQTGDRGNQMGQNTPGGTVYVDSSCTLDVCNNQQINMILSQRMRLNAENFDFVDVNGKEDLINQFEGKGINSFPLIELESTQGVNQNMQQFITQVGEKNYIMLGAWRAGKENVCNDGKDNDGDGKTDLEDEDCNKLKLLVDERCEEDDSKLCNTSQLKQQLESQMFSVGYVIEEVDYSSEEGKNLYAEAEEKKGEQVNLPVLFATDVASNLKKKLQQDNRMSEIELEEMNYMINLFPSEWDPTKADACFQDNGEINCELEQCSDYQACIPEEKGKLDVYIMGYCPYGEIAAQQIPAIQQQFKNDDIDLNIHYIVSKSGEGYEAEDFKSLHGTKEVKENFRQVCIRDIYSQDKLIEYQQARYKNAANNGSVSEAPSVAYNKVGIEKSQIDQCVNSDKAGKLLEEDMQFAQEEGVSASPKWIANGKYEFGGIKADKIINNFCKYNEQLQGCQGEINTQNNTNNSNNTNNDPTCN